MGGGALIFDDLAPVAEQKATLSELDERLRDADRPFVVRGLAAEWPLVAAGRESSASARAYLLGHARDRLFEVQVGRRGCDRVFYDERMGLDFQDSKVPLADAFARIEQSETMQDPPLIYLPSISIPDYFDGLERDNHLPLGSRDSRDGIWIGGQTRIAAHNDIANNVAVAAVGRRRFTLFPPQQFANLYLGPLEHSPGGRPISMVDFYNPDWSRFPRFRDALGEAVVAELDPGDALFIPAMWYHHVEALDRFNVLVNYWWNDEPRWLGHPEDALFLSLLAIRDLPEASREQWRAIFDHYVFRAEPSQIDHIPEAGRGILAPLDPNRAQMLRHYLIRRLSQ